MFIRDGDVDSSPAPRNSFELEQPSVRKIIDVSENRSAIDEVEISVLERQMGRSRYGGEVEGGAQVLLAPYDMTRADVDAPYLTLLREAVEPSDHSTRRAAEIQYSISFFNAEITRLDYRLYFVDVRFAHM
jgi:hypothetical protein